MDTARELFFVVEQGGYPVNEFEREFGGRGYRVTVAHSMRKALGLLKSHKPAAVFAEFNYTTHFRDRISNLEPLLARLQSTSPETRVIVFLHKEHDTVLDKLRARFRIDEALFYPLDMDSLLAAVAHCAPQQERSDPA